MPILRHQKPAVRLCQRRYTSRSASHGFVIACVCGKYRTRGRGRFGRGVSSFRVVDGVGGTANIDPSIAALFDPKQLTALNSIQVIEESQVFNMRGIQGGLTLRRPWRRGSCFFRDLASEGWLF